MKVISISKKELKKFPKYKLNSKISNTEGTKYKVEGSVLGLKDQTFIMKELREGISPLFYKNRDFTSKNIATWNNTTSKLYTIASLANYKEQIGIEEICIPEVLVEIEEYGLISYFLIPEIENATNLGLILWDKNKKVEEKVEYIYQIGSLLERILNLNLEIKINIGDLREYNFIVDEEKKVHIVDTDSFYLHVGYLPEAYYLLYMWGILKEHPEKYKNKINDNTDILCYISMIFATLMNSKIYTFDSKEYLSYLEYLKYLGFGKDILECFKRVCGQMDNRNPYKYLDQIPLDKLQETNNRSYKKYKKTKNLF